MSYTLPNDQKVGVIVKYVDAKGNPVDIQAGSVTWGSSDAGVVRVQVDAADDQKAEIFGVDNGNAQINVTADNTDGSQVISLFDVTIVSGAAVSGTVEPVGPPEPQAA